MLRFVVSIVLLTLLSAPVALCQEPVTWKHARNIEHGERPSLDDSGWETAAVSHKWRGVGARDCAWYRATVTIPETINGKPTRGQPVGMMLSAGDGGEIYVNGKLQSRYDNDHPGMALLAEYATPGRRVRIALRGWSALEGGEQEGAFHQAEWVLLDPNRVQKPFEIKVDAGKSLGKFPDTFSGLSQGGGMSDYDPATAARFKEAGIKWFRMDNVFTDVLKQRENGEYYYDWTSLDRRVDFVRQIGAEFILCASYMPQCLDDHPNNDRHSTPKDYRIWEELCYQAAKRYLEKGQRIRYWEVWNESNSGWLDPPKGEDSLVHYLKLYDATARGVRRADPSAWIGGPCNASGPWDQSPERGYCVNGRKFMRGLIEHCAKTGSPLDFISWHEYFQPWWTFREEMEQTQKYLDEFPAVKKQVKDYLITEWNYAWWHDRSQDNEVGAAWCATSVLRGMVPVGIKKPCFFFAKDGGTDLNGNWGMLADNTHPKPVYNACKLWNKMAPERIAYQGEDGDITGIASKDPKTGRITVYLVNFAERYGVQRRIRLSVAGARLPRYKLYLIDATHSNVFHDKNRCELEMVSSGAVHGPLEIELMPNSIAMVELED